MTNKTDNYYNRVSNRGVGPEITEGVSTDGFADANGEFPNREYFYATSVNKAAKGEKVNNLSLGGGDFGISLKVPDQKPSVFPYNQIQETPSGHSFEMDDTPGGERVLIRHRTGAGVELRSDGTVIISSRNQKIEVTGGDHTTIVEGEGNLVYKGNLNLHVDGDFNVNVNGNYNLKVGGDKKEEIKGRHSKTVNLDQNYTIRGARGEQVVGMATSTVLGDHNQIVAGSSKYMVQGNTEILSGNNLITTAVNEWVCSATTANMTANQVSMLGQYGTIGGAGINYYGLYYGGLPGGVTDVCSFHGTLVGKAAEALHADYAIFASTAEFSAGAGASMTAVTAGVLGAAEPPIPAVPVPGIMPYIPTISMTAYPNPAVVGTQLLTDEYGIRNVVVDPRLRDKISKDDDYKGLFNHDPDIHEIRSKLRDTNNLNNGAFTSYLVATGLLNKNFKKNIPKNIGRSASKNGTIRFGVNLLGNNPSENRSKRFKVNKR